MGPIKSLSLAAALVAAGPAFACEVPDEGNRPWRSAVAKVKYLPETEEWAGRITRDGGAVRYLVSVGELHRHRGRCWWPVEVRADGALWRRFYVTTDGFYVVPDDQRLLRAPLAQ